MAESLHWIWGRAQTLTLPRDGIFARSCKHDHQAGRVASGVGGVSGPAHDRARENNTFFGGGGGGVRGVKSINLHSDMEGKCNFNNSSGGVG